MWCEGMPTEVFKFHRRELDRWCDGREHVLRPGRDYPPDLDRYEIKRRLVLAASKRDVDITVWFLDGNVHFLMAPWARFNGVNPDIESTS